MKRLLLLGGMTPDVTVLYYNTINRVVRSALGGRNNAPLYLCSANLEDMIGHAGKGDWDGFASVYTEAITSLRGKIDGVVVGAILAHKVTRQLEQSLSGSGVPLLHVADYVAAHVRTEHPDIKTLGLLGPKITMTDTGDPDFFVGRLSSPENGHLEVLVPDTAESLEEVNRGMLEEVAKGAAAVTEGTRAMFVREAKRLVERGARGIILGSTDLGFVVKQEDLGDEGVVVIEPAAVHAEGVARWALGE